MWLMIELRLRRRLLAYLWLYAAAWAMAVGVSALFPAFQGPERLAVLAGSLMLVVVYFVQSAVMSFDSRESRPALEFALPLTEKQILARRIVEPLIPTGAVGVGTLALAAVLRLVAGGRLDAQVLIFGAALTALMLGFSQVHVFTEEIQRQTRRSVPIVLLIMATIAGFGAAVGYTLAAFANAGQDEIPTIVQLLGQGVVVGSFLVITVLLACLNHLLLARRRNHLD